MARGRKRGCPAGQKRYTVIQVGTNPYDSHAARSFEEALDLAVPDRGSTIKVYTVCAQDAGEARMPSVYRKRGRLTQTKRVKR